VEIADTENDSPELLDVLLGQRASGGQPDLDRLATLHVLSVQACWQRCRVVRDDEITRPKEVEQLAARGLSEVSAGIDHKNPGLRRTLDWLMGGDHRDYPARLKPSRSD
jgi:hypothetical protein